MKSGYFGPLGPSSGKRTIFGSGRRGSANGMLPMCHEDFGAGTRLRGAGSAVDLPLCAELGQSAGRLPETLAVAHETLLAALEAGLTSDQVPPELHALHRPSVHHSRPAETGPTGATSPSLRPTQPRSPALR